jgi:putative membrane protein
VSLVGADDEGWQRLDPRMLLIGPVQTVRQFAVPLVIAVLGISGSQGSFQPLILLPMAVVPVLLGFLPWLTTRYRVTPTQFQQRRGLLNRKQVTAPLDRVRSVDLESTLLHRALGLAKVQIGTGVDETRIELNSLGVAQAEELRHFLLARATPMVWPNSATSGAPDMQFLPNGEPVEPSALQQQPVPAYVAPELLARIDWSWLKFAPFSLSRLALVAGVIGALTQFGDNLPFLDQQHLDSASQWVLRFALPLIILAATVAALVAWVAVSVAGYVIQWWNLALTREQGTLRLVAGLFTTRSTSVEESRVRGVELTEPALLRLVKGGELATLATGVGSGGTTKVLPPCPVEVCRDVGHAVLGAEGPLVADLIPHGPAARRRCHIRAQWSTLIAAAVTTTVAIALGWPWWFPAIVAIAMAVGGVAAGEAAYRQLGHLLTPFHLTSGHGVLGRQRTVLERDGVIGWVVHQSFFQRRRGLATLTATTAAGAERVVVHDVPLTRAIALAVQVTPGAVTPFLSL